MKKSISTDFTEANVARVMELLSETPGKLENLRQGLTSEQLGRPLGAGERSFTEDLAHLIHCEARSSEAIYQALLLEKPLFADIHPERQWGKLLRFDLLPFPDLLAYFKLRRAVLLRVLSGLTDRAWTRSIREPGKQRQESVYWRARGLALHELDHLTDLEHKLNR
jgi:hypothetical protein